MNFTTRSISNDEYIDIMRLVKFGYLSSRDGTSHFPKPRVALALYIEATIGIRVSDCTRLTLSNFIRKSDGEWYVRLVEQKTGKTRNFVVPLIVKDTIFEFALNNGIGMNERLVNMTPRNVQKNLHDASLELGLDKIGTHSFRKKFSDEVYIASNGDIVLLSTILNHSSVETTRRYVSINAKRVKDALQATIVPF